MDKETEKQALEACIEYLDPADILSPMTQEEFDSHRDTWLAACKWMEARGRASGRQGVEGYKLVPVQPTTEMLSAAHCVTTEWYNRHGRVFPPHSKTYKAMLAASPQITSQEGTPK